MNDIKNENEKSEKKSRNGININSKKINEEDSLIDKSSGVSKKIEEEKKEKLSDASFSISNEDDIDALYEQLSKKSDDYNYFFESTLPNAKEDFDKEIDFQFEEMAKNEKGFDNDIKLISSNYYNNLVRSLTGGKNQQTIEKTNNMNTKYGSLSAGDEQTMKLKNDLSGVPLMIGPDVTNITANNDLVDKKKLGESDNEYLLKDLKFSKEESLSGINSKNKLDYKKTMSLEYSKEKESDKKEMISYSSLNKQSTNKRESKSSKVMEEQK